MSQSPQNEFLCPAYWLSYLSLTMKNIFFFLLLKQYQPQNVNKVNCRYYKLVFGIGMARLFLKFRSRFKLNTLHVRVSFRTSNEIKFSAQFLVFFRLFFFSSVIAKTICTRSIHPIQFWCDKLFGFPFEWIGCETSFFKWAFNLEKQSKKIFGIGK